jgi:hypothetical protein
MKTRLIIYPLLLIALFALWVQVTQPIFQVDNSAAIVSTDPQRLRTHVETISRDFYPRDEGHPENLANLAAYIQSAFEYTGADVTRHTFKVNGNNYSNVYAAFGPATQDRIIIGAHYDTVPGTPGADDNASGIAGLIELAHLLKNTALPTRVELAAYTLEEPPYFYTSKMGSAQHVKLLQQENVMVRMMFALEMIGYFSDEPDSQHLPMPVLSLLYPDEGNFIMVAGRFLDGTNVRIIKRAMRGASPLPVYSINAPGNVLGVDLSDHLSFWNADLPAVMITDTAFYRYDGYHSPTDTADRLDYERMAMVVEGVYAAVLALADEPD